MQAIVLTVLTVVYLVYYTLKNAAPKLFLVPPTDWKEKLLKVINYPKPVSLKVSLMKRSSYRRRIIGGSNNPSYYTNFENDKIRLYEDDIKDPAFIENLRAKEIKDSRRKVIYGFFHPYANNGGGGERVLWHAVRATLLSNDLNIAAIYTTNNDSSPNQILEKVQDKFNIWDLDSKRILFIYLKRYAHLIDGDYWKHFTLIGQIFGAMVLSLTAMLELSPDIWIDTMGLPGSYVLVNSILKIPIMSYVHYPIIQPEMFRKLRYQNMSQIRNFRLKSRDVFEVGKFFYWRVMFYLYKYLGSNVTVTLANGTWTYNKISDAWSWNRNLGSYFGILYPPCGTEHLLERSKLAQRREDYLLLIAQFRPEKRQLLVLNSYQKFLQDVRIDNPLLVGVPKLVFLGSCRTPGDTLTLETLKRQVEELSLHEYVRFVVDSSYEEMMRWLSISKFGLNAMWNEHFGISVVEYLGLGVIPICHATAGPILDIVPHNRERGIGHWVCDSGFFFKDLTDPDFDPSIQSGVPLGFLRFPDPLSNDVKTDYPTLTKLLWEICVERKDLVSDDSLNKMKSAAAETVFKKFSDRAFTERWMQHVQTLAVTEKSYRITRRDRVEQLY